MLNRRLTFWLAAWLVFPAAALAQSSLQRVIVTYSSRSIASIDLFIAQERGFFREEGSIRNWSKLETYRISRGAFTTNGMATDDEATEYLKADAQILGLAAPIAASKVFDFSLQREVNQELGVK